MSSSVTATFVFTDLVDSTATAARLGPQAAEELRQTHFRLLRGAVTASGGTEVKNLGDGLMVIYSSASRALVGAVGMQQAIEHHNRSGAEPLSVRIGVSTGEVSEEDGDYFGDPVVESARLCATASGGQILAADLVRLTVGRNATQTFLPLGPLELKGLPVPVEAIEVRWEPITVSGSVPLPGRLIGAASNALFGFFGRGPELAALHETRKRAHSTQRAQLVLIAGEAGMGKTALVAQMARTAHAEGSVVLFGHADEDLGVAYQPWVEVVSTLTRDGDPELVDGLRPAQRSALARLAPEIDDGTNRVADPDMERLLLLEAATALLAAASRQAPVVVVLDDLHWADTASLQLLRHAVASITPMDVTLAVTYRDTELQQGDPLNNLLSDLHREANVSRLPLRGLEDNELVELMTAAAGHDLDNRSIGLAHALRRETDGNPFFTAEMLRHLGESGAIVMGDDGRWTVADDLDELGLPSSVRDVVGRRVERLGAEARRVLRLATVVGRDFDLGVLARVADIDEELVLDILDAAVAAAILVEGDATDRYRFAHALIQHSLYEELSPARRQRAHQRVAEALESATSADDPATLAELARHWIAATRPTDLDKAIDYARRAGDAARDALAPDDAIHWYQQALDLLDRQTAPDLRTRAVLLVALGKAESSAGRADCRATLFAAAELAQRLDDSDLLVEAALGFTNFTGTQHGDAEANRVIGAALTSIGDGPTPTRARLIAALAETYDAAAQWRERREAALLALDTARLANDDLTFVDVIGSVHTVLEAPDRQDEAIEALETSLRLADRTGDPVRRARARFRAMWCCYQQLDLERADQLIREVGELTDDVGLPLMHFEHQLLVAQRQLLAGNVDQADEANARLLDIGTAAGWGDTLVSWGGILYAITQHRGRLDKIAELHLQTARDNPFVAALRSSVPAMLAEVGRVDEARERLANEALTGFDYPYDSLWLAAMANIADAAGAVGDRHTAGLLVERLTPFASQVICPFGTMVLGAVARPLARVAALVGQHADAERNFVLAHDVHTRLHAPYWFARGQLDHADLCMTRVDEGDQERARHLATTAAVTAADYGCAALSKRAAALLATI